MIEYFKPSFEDRNLSSSERKELKLMLAQNPLSPEGKGVLITGLFDLAETGLGQGRDAETMQWLKKMIHLLNSLDEKEEKSKSDKVYFSPGTDCLGAINWEIDSAFRTIDICVFTISDDRISEKLIQQHRKGVRVRIISDNDKLMDSGSDIERLAQAGIPVKIDRTAYHMHHKFALFDGSKAITGSYNWTRSAESYNNENLLVTASPAVVRQYKDAFELLWGKMEDY